MAEVEELAEQTMAQETRGAISIETSNINHQSAVDRLARYKWWIKMVIFIMFVLVGQSTATLLGRLYFAKGGNSKWMATLVQNAGFPVLLPFLFVSTTKNHTEQDLNIPNRKKPSLLKLVSVYSFIGTFLAAISLLYSVGLDNLPVSTYSLITASQLAFNAFFSFFLNSQKFTPFIINCLVLITMSSVLLVVQSGSGDNSKISKRKYAIGFICTVAGAACAGLLFSITQLAFTKILKKQTFKVVIDLIFYECAVATFVILIAFFASGDWKLIKPEMEVFELGKVSYVMTLVWTAVAWQVFSLGYVGLIFEVSSLFSNVISTLGLPIVPILAVVFFHDKMSGVKVISMLLSIWGFASYIYQHYLDDLKSKDDIRNGNEVSPIDEVTQ